MEWVSILPRLLAILVVVWKKEVISALFAGIFLAEFLLLDPGFGSIGTAWLNSLERIVGVFTDGGNARLLVFSLMIGALLAFVRTSGGVSALVDLLVNRGIASSPRRTTLLTSAVGGAVFVESNLSILTAGILSRGLFDKFNLGRARLAYIIDSTSAPVCILILLNGWGAFILALLNNYELSSASAVVLWGSVPFNFYAILRCCWSSTQLGRGRSMVRCALVKIRLRRNNSQCSKRKVPRRVIYLCPWRSSYLA